MTRLDKLLGYVKGFAESVGDQMGAWASSVMSGFMRHQMEQFEKDFAERIRPMLEAAESGKSPEEVLATIRAELDNPTSQIGAFLGQTAGGIAAGGLISSTIGPFLLIMQYQVQRLARQWRFDPLMALAVYIRGEGKTTSGDLPFKDLARADILDSGMDEGRWQALLHTAWTRMEADDIILLRRRGVLTTAEYYPLMDELGYGRGTAESLYESREVYPPPADMTRFADFGAFDPVIIEMWQEYYNAPGWIRDPMESIGITGEWPNKYWFSHWHQPGRYELGELHRRRLIHPTDDAVQDDLVKKAYLTQGFSAFWQDKLLGLVENPLTRVDTRRMHRVGELSMAELSEAYRAVGFYGENNRRMVDFTLKYNLEGERLLTKGDILGSLRKGIIAESAARDMLSVLGYAKEDIDILIAEPPAAELEATRTLTLTQLRQLYERNLRPWADIAPFLGALGFSPADIAAIRALWSWEKPLEDKEKTRDLTLSHVRQLYERGLQPRGQISAWLAGMGYDSGEILSLFNIWDWEKPLEISAKTRDLTLTHVRQLYELGLRTRSEVAAWLAAMGYDAGEVKDLLGIWDWEAPPKIKQPSRADLDRFLSNAVIGFFDWVAEYQAQGWGDKYIGWYFSDLVARGKTT